MCVACHACAMENPCLLPCCCYNQIAVIWDILQNCTQREFHVKFFRHHWQEFTPPLFVWCILLWSTEWLDWRLFWRYTNDFINGFSIVFHLNSIIREPKLYLYFSYEAATHFKKHIQPHKGQNYELRIIQGSGGRCVTTCEPGLVDMHEICQESSCRCSWSVRMSQL